VVTVEAVHHPRWAKQWQKSRSTTRTSPANSVFT
jgi:hypothetical protein